MLIFWTEREVKARMDLILWKVTGAYVVAGLHFWKATWRVTAGFRELQNVDLAAVGGKVSGLVNAVYHLHHGAVSMLTP